MPEIRGLLEARGPIIEVSVMASAERVAILKRLGKPYPPPTTIRALLDTGAYASAIDGNVLAGGNFTPSGVVAVHTATTGPDYVMRDQFDVCVVIGSQRGKKRAFTVAMIATDLASEGFLALIGWDILDHCVLICDGPRGEFRLTC